MTDKKLLIILLLVYLYPVNIVLAAQLRLRFGKLEIIPHFKTSLSYESNIYREKENSREDFIWTLSPGVTAKLPVKNHNFQFDYTSDIIYYTKYHNYSSFDNILSFMANLNSERRFQANFSEVFQDLTVPETTEIVRRTERIQNEAAGDVHYKITPRLHTKAEYGQTSHRYKEEVYQSLLDRNRNEFTGSLYHTFPLNLGIVEVKSGVIDYADINNLNDSRYIQVMLGLEGNLSPRIEGTVKFGQHSRNYTSPSKNDVDAFVFTIKAAKNITVNNSLELSCGKKLIESIYAFNSYYVSNEISVEFFQLIAQRFFLLVGEILNYNQYPYATTVDNITQRRKDFYWNHKIGIGYRINMFFFSVEYHYIIRNSNFNIFNYTDKKIFFKIRKINRDELRGSR